MQRITSRWVGLLTFVLLLAAVQGLALADFSTVIQAEDMDLTSVMAVGEVADAFGGKYISVPEGSNTREPAVEATVDVEVPADGNYALWVRLYGPNGDADAMYAWIDDAAPARFFTPSQEVWHWIHVADYDLSAGGHTIKVGHGEINARVDAIYLSDTGAEPPASMGFTAQIEGESLSLTDALGIGEDAAASGGKYIFAASGSSTRSPVAEGEGTLTVPADGDYTVWVRIFGPTGDSDAMYVWIDDTTPMRFFPPSPGGWYWVEIGEYNLSAGDHTVYVGKGEIDARIDAIYVSDDPANAPE